MDDYISRRDAKAAIQKALYDGTGYGEALDAVPPADVRPVVRGYWTDGRGNRVPWDEMNPDCPAVSAYCSACGEWLTASDEYTAIGNFCPNCGADMTGGDAPHEW